MANAGHSLVLRNIVRRSIMQWSSTQEVRFLAVQAGHLNLRVGLQEMIEWPIASIHEPKVLGQAQQLWEWAVRDVQLLT